MKLSAPRVNAQRLSSPFRGENIVNAVLFRVKTVNNGQIWLAVASIKINFVKTRIYDGFHDLLRIYGYSPGTAECQLVHRDCKAFLTRSGDY